MKQVVVTCESDHQVYESRRNDFGDKENTDFYNR